MTANMETYDQTIKRRYFDRVPEHAEYFHTELMKNDIVERTVKQMAKKYSWLRKFREGEL